VGQVGLPLPYLGRLWAAGLAAAALGWGIKLSLSSVASLPMLSAALILVPFALAYGALCHLFGVSEARAFVSRFMRKRA
jgi:hypothetical protein